MAEYLELENPADLKFRPTVARPVCKTRRLSNSTNFSSKPFVQHVKRYIREVIDFLTYLPEHIIEETLSVFFDVTNLYNYL